MSEVNFTDVEMLHLFIFLEELLIFLKCRIKASTSCGTDSSSPSSVNHFCTNCTIETLFFYAETFNRKEGIIYTSQR